MNNNNKKIKRAKYNIQHLRPDIWYSINNFVLKKTCTYL